jgi:hypothetical protein
MKPPRSSNAAPIKPRTSLSVGASGSGPWAIAGSIWKIRENFRVRKRAGFQSLRRLCR